MNEALLKLVHRAIRCDRAALRSLIERYQGFTYALAYRHAKGFPRAQRVAQAAWPLAAEALSGLTEPERFPELLARAVDRAFRNMGEEEDASKEELPEEHSILRTEKVQARRALRNALAACPLAEAPVFFMRYVEGLSMQEIADLYGVERTLAVESLRLVCVDLAFRSGFADASKTPPQMEKFSPARQETLGFSVVASEGSLDPEKQSRLEHLIQTDPACRRDDEAVKNVLGLATGTFSAHSLPPEFVRDVLLAIPFAEPVRRVRAGAPDRVDEAPGLLRKEIPHGAALTSCLGIGLLALLGVFGVLCWLMESWTAPASGAAASGLTTALLLSMGCAVVALGLARPPVFATSPRLPLWYYLAYGVVFGCVLAIATLFVWVLAYQSLRRGWAVVLAGGSPFACMASVALLGIKARLALLDLEKRFEQRIRRIEDVLPMAASVEPDQRNG